jgi:hypothetical protein
MVAISLIATGMFALPHGAPQGSVPLEWNRILPVTLDIDSTYKFDSRFIQNSGVIVALAAQLAVVFLAFSWRCWTPFALAIAPLLLITALRIGDCKWIAYQLVGVPYPLALCATAYLLDEVQTNRRRLMIVSGLLVVLILPRVPHMVGMLHRYVLSPEARFQYKLADFDALAKTIGRQTVECDADDVNTALPVMLEFGRRNVNVQWSPDSWNVILGYRQWPVPHYQVKPDYQLDSREMQAHPRRKRVDAPITSTERYLLYRCHSPAADQ